MNYKHTVLWAVALLQFLVVACTQTTGETAIIPTPVELTKGKGEFTLKNDMSIGVADESLLPAGEYLKNILSNAVSTTVFVGNENADFHLSLDASGKENGYELNVSSKQVSVKATDYAGTIAAISTIRQLLPAEIEQTATTPAKISIPAVTIKDAPRLEWRGLMLDASRHFWNVDEVKEVLDMMALYKFNKFHWHLTDDQGWRIEIKKYPLLTEKGAWRKFNSHDKSCMSLAKSQHNTDYLIPEDKLKVIDGDTLYGGFYTQEDIKDIINYAAQRGIEVIPEIDMPGHFLAAIGQYPDVACSGLIGWGETFSSPICPGKDSALEFCKNIYKEVFELFPSNFVHLGGDEVEKINWKKCKDCQRRIKQEKLGDEEELQAWFVRYMEKFFNENGKDLIGWDEVGRDGLSNRAVIMWWRTWNPKAIPNATAEGKRVVGTPNSVLYFDYEQDRNSVIKILEHEPVMTELNADQQKLVLGVQGNLWTEWVPSIKRVEYMLMPRMIALSEIAWAAPENKLSGKEFYKTAVPHFKRMDKMGINYRIPDLEGFFHVNAFVDEANVNVSCPLPGVEIRYTTDGSTPTIESPLYKEGMKVTETTNFKFRTFRPDGSPSDIVETKFVKSPYGEPDSEANPTETGLKAVWHEYKGEKCTEIDKYPVNGEYTVEAISIPKGVKGNIGLIITGYMDIPADDIYTFALLSDDGSTLKINGEMALDNDGAHSPREVIAQKALRKGLHKIEVRYFDHNGGMLEMYLIDKDGQKQPLPKEWYKH